MGTDCGRVGSHEAGGSFFQPCVHETMLCVFVCFCLSVCVCVCVFEFVCVHVCGAGRSESVVVEAPV